MVSFNVTDIWINKLLFFISSIIQLSIFDGEEKINELIMLCFDNNSQDTIMKNNINILNKWMIILFFKYI